MFLYDFPQKKNGQVKGTKKLTCSNNLMKCCVSCHLFELLFAIYIATVWQVVG